MSMALVMSAMPDVWRKVLAEHVPDQGQRCRECRNASGETASWPCQTYRVAQEAKWVSEGNLPGTGPHGSVSPRATSEAPPSAPSRSSWDQPSWDQPSWDQPSWDRPAARDPLSGSWDRDPLAGRSFGGPYDPPPQSGPVPGLGSHGTGGGGGRHSGGTGSSPYGSRMDAPYGASFGVDDSPRGPRY